MRALYIFLFCLFLTACGGSGGGVSGGAGEGETGVAPSPSMGVCGDALSPEPPQAVRNKQKRKI